MSAPGPTKGKGQRQPREGSIPFSKAQVAQAQQPTNVQANRDGSDSELSRGFQPTTPPRTPRQFGHQSAPSQTKISQAAASDGNKQNSRQKYRSRNDLASPGLPVGGHKGPNSNGLHRAGIPASPRTITAPSAAYAGPTFHASPAPSALPIPSFYSKSVPASSDEISGITGPEIDPHEFSTPPPTATENQQFQALESPLDLFFKADREEKARAKSASSVRTQPNVSRVFTYSNESLPTGLDSPMASYKRHTHQGRESRNSAEGIFAMDMERAHISSTFYGPAFSTPYSERINAAKLSHTSDRPIDLSSASAKAPLDRSEALKAYLFPNDAAEIMMTGKLPFAPNTSDRAPRPDPAVHTPTSLGLPKPMYDAGEVKSWSRIPGSDQAHSANHVSHTIAGRRLGHSHSLRNDATSIESSNKKLNLKESVGSMPRPSASKPQTSVSEPVVPSVNVPTKESHVPRTTSSDLQGMEDSLRKILKLESTRNS